MYRFVRKSPPLRMKKGVRCRKVIRYFSSSSEDSKGDSKRTTYAKMYRGEINYFPDFIHSWSPERFKAVGVGLSAVSAATLLKLGVFDPLAVSVSAATGLYLVTGFKDLSQKRHTIRRNYPVIGRLRYVFETLRPEIYQYFVER